MSHFDGCLPSDVTSCPDIQQHASKGTTPLKKFAEGCLVTACVVGGAVDVHLKK